MSLHFSCVILALTGCAATTAEGPSPGSTVTSPIRFQAPEPPPVMPHREATGRRAAPMFLALEKVLPARETYDVASLSCVHIAFPNNESTHCRVDDLEVSDEGKAWGLMEAAGLVGAQQVRGNKMPAFHIVNVHATREGFTFDEAADAARPNAPNVRIEGTEMLDVMNALASLGIKEDDGTLDVVCTVAAGTSTPSCGYFQQYRAGAKLDAAQSRALWNVFVNDPSMTLLTAAHFAYDGHALTFRRVLNATHVPDWPAPPPMP